MTAIFSESDRAALDDLWRVYEGHAAAISDEIMPKLASEPALGAVLSSDSEQGRKHCAAFLSSWTSKGGQDRALADAELERCQEFFSPRGASLTSWMQTCLLVSLSEAETIAFVLDVSERKRLESVRARSVELETENRRIREGATKKHAGTGLGLALTKRLVEAQGGSVGVKTSDDHKRLRQLAHGVVEKNSWRPSAFLDEIRGLIAGPGSLRPKSEVA